MLTVDPLVPLVDMFEEAASNGKRVSEITGPDVAAFADELLHGERSYQAQQGKKLNERLNK